MLDAVRVLLREALQRPLLLIFEDLHWIDNETQAVLDSLVESLASARILLLANLSARVPAWLGGQDLLQPAPTWTRLQAQSGGRLLDALLGNDPSLASLKQLLVKRWQSVLSGGDWSGHWWRRRRWRVCRAVIG